MFGFLQRHLICYLIWPIKAKLSHFFCLILSLASIPMIKTAFPSENEAFKVKNNKVIERIHSNVIPSAKKGMPSNGNCWLFHRNLLQF